MSSLELRQENDRRKTLGMTLLDGDEGLTKQEAAKKRKEVSGCVRGRGWLRGEWSVDFLFFFIGAFSCYKCVCLLARMCQFEGSSANDFIEFFFAAVFSVTCISGMGKFWW